MTQSTPSIDSTLRAEILKLEGPIVIFGAGGFIGSNLTRGILSCRQDVFGVTHQSYIPWRLTGLNPENILRCDLNRDEDVERLFAKHAFKTVFFFASYGSYSRQSDPTLIYQTNVSGLLRVIESASRQGLAALVHAGSSSEYGLNCQAPSEEAVLQPNSHYAVSKVAASYMIQYVAKTQMLPLINLRLYSVYGPAEESDRLIPTLIRQGMQKKYPPFVDPDISRDFVYIDDVLEAVVLAATRGVASAPGASINIATGKATTIRELAGMAKDLFGIEGSPAWSSMPNRSWDLKEWYGNPGLADEKLGWRHRTSLRQGLEKTWLWFQARPEWHSL